MRVPETPPSCLFSVLSTVGNLVGVNLHHLAVYCMVLMIHKVKNLYEFFGHSVVYSSVVSLFKFSTSFKISIVCFFHIHLGALYINKCYRVLMLMCVYLSSPFSCSTFSFLYDVSGEIKLFN